ncbi:hypothetical protein EXS70_00985 [Candidatus Peribacteria bacterium]|nr:hypothetical protein [Candidatus Peribacteria bacterium]
MPRRQPFPRRAVATPRRARVCRSFPLAPQQQTAPPAPRFGRSTSRPGGRRGGGAVCGRKHVEPSAQSEHGED